MKNETPLARAGRGVVEQWNATMIPFPPPQHKTILLFFR